MKKKPFKFFDSLVHIKEDGSWYKTEKSASVEKLKQFFEDGVLDGAVVAIMPDDDIESVAKAVNKDLPHCKIVVSVKKAWLNLSVSELTQIFSDLKSRFGIIGIKIHPRFSCLDMSNEKVVDKIIDASTVNGLLVYICTLFRAPSGPYPQAHSYLLSQIAKRNPAVDIVFLHGGYVDLFATAEFLRDCPNAWLDLSFTFMRFRKSSLALDVGFLFEGLDQKIVIGTDYPESTPVELFEAVERYVLSRSDLCLSEEKLNNIFYSNMKKLVTKYET